MYTQYPHVTVYVLVCNESIQIQISIFPRFRFSNRWNTREHIRIRSYKYSLLTRTHACTDGYGFALRNEIALFASISDQHNSSTEMWMDEQVLVCVLMLTVKSQLFDLATFDIICGAILYTYVLCAILYLTEEKVDRRLAWNTPCVHGTHNKRESTTNFHEHRSMWICVRARYTYTHSHSYSHSHSHSHSRIYSLNRWHVHTYASIVGKSVSSEFWVPWAKRQQKTMTSLASTNSGYEFHYIAL